jgi:hypothetical protein
MFFVGSSPKALKAAGAGRSDVARTTETALLWKEWEKVT